MAKGYDESEVKTRLIDLLKKSKTGMSGIEISENLGINRTTMAKYLDIFAAEGIIQQRNVGNTHLWLVEEGIEKLQFPDDYFKVQEEYLGFLNNASGRSALGLIRNCMNSEANSVTLITEVILPTIKSVKDLFEEGKIGTSEQNLLFEIILDSIKIINLQNLIPEPQKNIVVFSSDIDSILISEATSAAFHARNWKVSSLGNMSSTMDVLFDLDLKKLLTKIWKGKEGIMIIVVCSSSEESLKFFSEAFQSVKGKNQKNLNLILNAKIGKKIDVKSDLITDDLDEIIQWAETAYENASGQ